MNVDGVEYGQQLWTARGLGVVLAVKKSQIRWRNRQVESLEDQFAADDVTVGYQAVVESLGWTWRVNNFDRWLFDVDLVIASETVRVVGTESIWIPDLHRLHQTCHHCEQEWPCAERRLMDELRAGMKTLLTLCACCGEASGWKAKHGRVILFPDGRRFHWLKATPKCVAAAVAAADKAGLTILGRGGDYIVAKSCGHDRLEIGCDACRTNAKQGLTPKRAVG